MGRCLLLGVMVCVAGILSAGLVRAQEVDSSKPLGFFIGPVAAYSGVSYNSAAFPIYDSVFYAEAENGSGGGQFLGITAEFPLSHSHHSSIVSNIILDYLGATFTSINSAVLSTYSRQPVGGSISAV